MLYRTRSSLTDSLKRQQSMPFEAPQHQPSAEAQKEYGGEENATTISPLIPEDVSAAVHYSTASTVHLRNML